MKLASKSMFAFLLAVMMIPMAMVVAFAADEGEPFSIDYSSIFSEEMFAPLLEGITSNVWNIFIVGLSLFDVFMIVRYVIPIILDKCFGIFFAAGSVWKWSGDEPVELWEYRKSRYTIRK